MIWWIDLNIMFGDCSIASENNICQISGRYFVTKKSFPYKALIIIGQFVWPLDAIVVRYQISNFLGRKERVHNFRSIFQNQCAYTIYRWTCLNRLSSSITDQHNVWGSRRFISVHGKINIHRSGYTHIFKYFGSLLV